MVDHDQRFKTLLKAFFAEFFQVFFPDWSDRFEFSRVDWLSGCRPWMASTTWPETIFWEYL